MCIRDRYKDVPRLFDAWDIDSNYREQEVEAAVDVKVEIQSQGLEAILKVTGRISESSYTQYIRLAADRDVYKRQAWEFIR